MHPAVTLLAGSIVTLFGCALIGFTALALARPDRATRFLDAFASSAQAHFTEQLLRLAAGGALVLYAPLMQLSRVFEVLGWLLLVTAVGLMFVPWRWHRRFAEFVVPPVTRHLNWYAGATCALGLFILWGVLG